MMRRQFGTFQSLSHLLNYLIRQGTECSILVCSSKTDSVGEIQSPLHLPIQAPTLCRLIQSRGIELYFVPSLAHLRVALSTGLGFQPKSARADAESAFIVVANCLSFHTSIGQGAQGIAQTIAIALETADAAEIGVLLAECITKPSSGSFTINEASSRPDGWDIQVPILNAGISGIPRRPWAGKSVSASKVVSQWCEQVEAEETEQLVFE
jgi:hypothetical protein